MTDNPAEDSALSTTSTTEKEAKGSGSILTTTILPMIVLVAGLVFGFYLGYVANSSYELLWLQRPALIIEMIFSGIACGVMINIALGRKVSEIGGWVGGALVGILMYIL